MTKKEAIKIFDDRKVRTLWDTEKEQWYFSIVDVIAVLTDQNNYQGARNYWKVLKFRLLKEGTQFANLTDIITKAWADKTTKYFLESFFIF
jgi:hypothetical protein